MPRSPSNRNSPLAIAFLNRLEHAGVKNLSVSQQESVDRLNAAWKQVRAERIAAGRAFFQQRSAQ